MSGNLWEGQGSIWMKESREDKAFVKGSFWGCGKMSDFSEGRSHVQYHWGNRERPRPWSCKCIPALLLTHCCFSPTPSAVQALDPGSNPRLGKHRIEVIFCSWPKKKPKYFYVLELGCFQLQRKPNQNEYLAQQLCRCKSGCFLPLVENGVELR